MTLEAERELWELAQAGDAGALDELVRENVDSLWPIARALAQAGGKWEPEDLFQEGALAMVSFAERWRPQAGIPFAVAAKPRCRGAMKDFLRRKADTVRGGQGQPLSLDHADEPGGRTLGETLAAEQDELGAMDLTILTPLEREVVAATLVRQTYEQPDALMERLGKSQRQIAYAHRRALGKLRQAAHGC